MFFYHNLYVSDRIRDPLKIRRRLTRNMRCPGIYIIAADPEGGSAGKAFLLDAVFLRTGWYKEHPPYIIGLALGREDAMELTGRILLEALEETGRADITGYLFPHGIRKTGGAGS